MRRNIFFNSIIFVFLVFVDQISKYLIRFRQPADGFFVCNKNIAFGINVPIFAYWFVIIILAFLVIFLLLNSKFKILNEIKIYKLKNLKLIENYHQKFFIPNSLFIILIIAGAISNLIDRLYFGCVIDFIDLKVWPIFNLADAYITIGAILIILSLFKKPKSTE
ncbi:MAG: hypothetical protein A3J63_03795 [Candidatus Moranbacteria bacterium RIFCSPHIGHO2_02_FULL_40_12b]|nr:MAG: hypothetical protein A3J63_03795 [Candidatus Moranbacteria bacterium RIFCSPHIGHO2_02_FULL_40_12b]